jgi:hypothetical protein
VREYEEFTALRISGNNSLSTARQIRCRLVVILSLSVCVCGLPLYDSSFISLPLSLIHSIGTSLSLSLALC